MYGSRSSREPPYLSRYRSSDHQEWKKKSIHQNPRQMIEENFNQRKARNRVVGGIVVLCLVFLLLGGIILSLLGDRAETSLLCVPGFVGTNCEKSNFLGTFAWSTNDFYVLADGLQHRKGIAFRVFAPRARSVRLNVLPVTGTDHSYYMMYVAEKEIVIVIMNRHGYKQALQ